MIKFGFLANNIIYRDRFDLSKENLCWSDLLKWCKLPATARLFIGCRCSQHGGLCPVVGMQYEDYSCTVSLLCHPVGGKGRGWKLGDLTEELNKGTSTYDWRRQWLRRDVKIARQVDTANQILIRHVDMGNKHIIFGSSDWIDSRA